MLGMPARDRIGDGKESSEAAHVKGIQPAFLTRVEGPCLTTIEKGAQYTGLIHLHLCVDSQQGVIPDSRRKASHCR